jgi:ABC-type cobalamin transport system ATPase subunit
MDLLETLRRPEGKTLDDLWNVRLIDDDFHRLMFEMEGGRWQRGR